MNIHELVQHVGHLLAAEAPTGVVIERDYDPSLPAPAARPQPDHPGAAEPRRATPIQAVGARGRIVLRTRALTNASIGSRRYRVVACIQVEDDGPGRSRRNSRTPSSTRWSPGARAAPGSASPSRRTSIGRHDGLIEFDSRPGRTVFTLLLPFENHELSETA